jgi:hypothetical protein
VDVLDRSTRRAGAGDVHEKLDQAQHRDGLWTAKAALR